MKNSQIYTKEKLEEAVKNCNNISQVCRYFGKYPKGGTYEVIKSRIKFYNIDISHFLGKSSHCGYNHTGSCKRKTPDQILTKNKIYREKASKLRRCLLELDYSYECSICKINSWNNKEITLEIDHINGDWTNCEKENLRFLCPNCHSQTDTYSGKKNGN